MAAPTQDLDMTPAWTLRAWPPVYRAAAQPMPCAFEHRTTRVFEDEPKTRRRTGQTMWVWPTDDGDVGVAWDWIQVSRGVVSMLDPMSVLTNMKLLGDSGQVLTAWQAARHLNEIVFMLPWQQEVRRALSFHHAGLEQEALALDRPTLMPMHAEGWADAGAAGLYADHRQ